MHVLPPGPSGPPLIGILPALIKDRLGCLLRWQKEYGDVVWLPMPARQPPAVLLSHPDLVERVLVSEASGFRKGTFQRQVLVATGAGVFTSEGAQWRQQRRFLQPHLHGPQVAAYGQAMVQQALGLAAQWAESDGEPRDIFPDCRDLTLRIAARTLFGVDVTELTTAIGESFHDLGETLQGWVDNLLPRTGFTATPELRRMRAATRRLDALVYRIIAERRAAPAGERADVLSLLLLARDEADGRGLSDRQLRDEVLTLLIASSETLALTLAWGLYLLAHHPAVADQLRAELHEVLGSRLPVSADLPALTRVDMVTRETLRLYPPTWLMSRTPITDWSVAGYQIPRGTAVLLCPYLLHRDPRYFVTPERFLPERWRKPLPPELPRYAYFPFGGGPRVCLGSAFANLELQLVLATLLPRLALTPVPERVPGLLPHFTLQPDGGIWLRTARQPSGTEVWNQGSARGSARGSEG